MKKIYYFSFLLIFSLFLSSCKKGFIEIYEIKSEIENCSLPYVVNFEVDLTYEGDEIEYHWEFGDGAMSNDKNPVHIYSETGVYVVTLKVNNYEATQEETISLDIQNETIPVVSDFEYEFVSKEYAPAEINFYNQSKHSSDFLWNFDDGLGSDDFETSHIFDTAGIYNVSLRAICNGDTAYHTEAIQIKNPPQDIYVENVKVWLPNEQLNKEVELEIKYSIFSETPVGLNNIIVNQSPISWNLFQELFFFDGEYDEEILAFEIWDIHNNNNPIYTFAITMYQIAELHYPDVLVWDNNNGYSAEVQLQYVN